MKYVGLLYGLFSITSIAFIKPITLNYLGYKTGSIAVECNREIDEREAQAKE